MIRLKLVIAAILVLYLLTRLYNLTGLPIFFDEANYIYWAKRIATGEDGWFLPLSGGKNILYPWSAAILLRLFPQVDYLFLGRLPSVVAGAVSLVAVYKLARLVFGVRVAVLSAVLYVFMPLALFYERMALYDASLNGALGVALYFLIKTARSLKGRDAACLGIALGVAYLAKATAIIYGLLIPFALILLIPDLKANWKRGTFLIGLSWLVSQIVANIIIVSSGYSEYWSKALDHSPDSSALLAQPLALFWQNISLTLNWLNYYVPSPLLLVSVAGLILLIFNKNTRRGGLVFALLSISPILVMAFFGREYFARYLVPLSPFAAITAAYFLTRLPKLGFVVFLSLILYVSVNFSFFALTAPEKTPLPAMDSWQYTTGFPSGYGLSAVWDFIRERKADGKVILVIQGSYSHYPNAFILEFWGDSNVTIIERWPFTNLDPEILNLAKENNLYLILSDQEIVGDIKPLRDFGDEIKVIRKFEKPGGRDAIYIAQPN